MAVWKVRAEQPVDPAEAGADDALAVRLRRLSGRLADDKAADADTRTATETTPTRLTLAGNPFALLEVEFDASAAAISDAYDQLSFEPDRDPAALMAARAAILAPRDRLDAELAWLPGLPGATRAAARKALRDGDVATLASIRNDKATGLARLNLGVALAEAAPRDFERAAAVLADAQRIEADALLDQFDDARFRGGFRAIDRAAFDEALDARATAIGAQLAPAFAATPASRNALTQALRDVPVGVGFAAAFNDALLRSYGAEIAALLEQSQLRITATSLALREQPGSDVHATTLLTALDLWSSLRRPMQVHEAARGLDDPASAEIMAAVRGLVIALSNDHSEFEIALRLARALVRCFALVPASRAALEREMPTLIANALAKYAEQLKARALSEPRDFARQVEAGGLDRPTGIAGAIATLFASADDVAADCREFLFLLIRGIAVTLHNEHRQTRAAYLLTAWLATQGPPQEVAAQLEKDLQHFGVRATVVARDQGEAPASENRPSGSFGRAAGTPRPASAPTRPPRIPASVERQSPRRGSKTLAVIFGLCVLTSFCSHLGNRRRVAPEPRATPSGLSTPVAAPSTDWRTEASEESALRRARIKALLDQARAEARGVPAQRIAPAQRVYIPGEPMSDARPMNPVGEPTRRPTELP
ncbi:hypothetical protein AB2M62_05070 [Sphingomonas sp. MMS12-HWE2-04]|uniref:hypothetical protein n=1 Tax=Sphingomonas sp. MMS12-HWE2-04 TaxID=3234199 RepID=UPI00384AD32B